MENYNRNILDLFNDEDKKGFPTTEKESDKSKSNSEPGVRSLCSEFIQETTIHGINKLTGSRSTRRRLIWTLIVLCSAGYMIFTLTKELKNYYSYPTMSSIDINFVKELPFPAITVCNLCGKNRSTMHVDEYFFNYFLQISPVDYMGPKINWSDPHYKQNGYFDDMVVDALYQSSMTKEKMFPMCFFDTDEMSSCHNAFTNVITPLGLCHTFNNDGKRKTKFSGARYNFHFYANIFQDEYTWDSDISAGLKIVVHDPGEYPDVVNKGFTVMPGTSVYSVIKQTKYEFLPYPYKAFGEEYCYEPEDGVNEKDVYSHSNCIHSCISRELLKRCKCVYFSDGLMPICSYFMHKECYLPELAKLQGDAEFQSKCDCKRPCDFSTYTTMVSTSQYPSDFIGNVMVNQSLGSSLQSIRNNRMYVRIYFDEMLKQTIKQLPQYTNIESILANVGGQMGVFLGASFLTVTELVEFMIILSCVALSALCRPKTKDSTKVVHVKTGE